MFIDGQQRTIPSFVFLFAPDIRSILSPSGLDAKTARDSRAAGLFPSVAAATFNRQADRTGARLSMTSEGGGVIYFTRNGADPRVPGTGEMAAGVQRLLKEHFAPEGLRCSLRLARIIAGRAWALNAGL